MTDEKIINNVVAIPLEYICVNPNQPRKIINYEELRGLMNSIEENGLLQPVTLRKINDVCYEIIAGERRSRACMELGYKYIPAIVENISEEQSAVLALVENIQRKNLNFFEEAQAMENIMKLKKINQQELGEMLGKTQGAVANKLRLLKLSRECEELILVGNLTERHARAVLKIPDEKNRLSAVKHIIKYNLNVEQSEKYIKSKFKKVRGATSVFCNDVRIFSNTVDKAMEFMKSAGFFIKSEKKEDDEYINYSIKISKHAQK